MRQTVVRISSAASRVRFPSFEQVHALAGHTFVLKSRLPMLGKSPKVTRAASLACKVLVKDIGSSKITIEPLLGLSVIKDLIVDMEPFFDHFRSMMPYLINDESPPVTERLQSPEERERFDDTTKCILCAACTTSCPSYWANDKYVGPAAIVYAHRFIFDSRDRAAAERLNILNDQFGVYRCHTIFNCTLACPRDIQITTAIGEVKKAIATGSLD